MPANYLSWIYLGAMVLLFYFVLIRPNQKRQKERVQMLNKVKKGDKVITIGGLHGTVMDITDERVTLKVSDNSRLVFERSAINSITTAEQEETQKEQEQEDK
ncbi:preprotein translocase subunit YajC [Risungbinella massiliensis]|uniref:preprotein translocase subunit YajC n=1 Tax=Risungbinella massiliensis TaxID=1329796 RepID=UPI0005CBF2D7|nr:preprotein translocase subunit YajC [Risungbinella massiliensis]